MMTYKSFFILIFSLFILSCQKENSSENQQYNNLKSFEVSISANNHLRADVTATFSENTSFCIAYWEVNNPSKIKKTNSLKYRIGEGGTIKPNEKYFSHGMHCANPIAPNEVLVIDNARNNQNTGSRALVFRVNEHSQSVDVPLMVSLPKGVFSGNRSNAQFINNDLILFALSTERNIIITNKNENPEIKRQISLTNTFYRIQYISDIQY